MNHDKETLEAAEKYFLQYGAFQLLIGQLRPAPEENAFLAGVKWREENPKPVSGELAERATAYALKQSNKQHTCPCCGEVSLWHNSAENFEAGAISERERMNAIVKPLVEALSQIAGMRFVAHNRPLDAQMIAIAMKALENYKKQIEKI